MANEKRLIDANALLYEYCQANGCNEVIDEICPNCFTADLIANAPTVDAVEVVHGRWIVGAVEVDHPFLEFESVWRDVHQCSICKEYFDVSDARNYCPNCGAKMDGDINND